MAINIEKLNEIIVDSKISYTELAEKTGMSKTQISRIVNGHVDKLRPTTIGKICSVLNISCKDLRVKEEPKSE